MIRNNFCADRALLEEHIKSDGFIDDTGLTPEELRAKCDELVSSMGDADRMLIKAEVIAFILKNARINARPYDIFPCRLDHGDILYDLRIEWKKALNATHMKEHLAACKPMQSAEVYHGDLDYSHTSPDWRSVLRLGVKGLAKRAREYSERGELSDSQVAYYKSIDAVYSALPVYMKRLAALSRRLDDGIAGTAATADTLEALTARAPQTLYEAMMLTVIFYYTQNYLDCSYVRSLGGLDELYIDFYRSDLKSGRYTEGELAEIIKYFFTKLNAFKNPNNIPFYLCGTDENGKPFYNELTYILLKIYDSLSIPDPKIQIRFNKDMPSDILRLTAGMISRGNNSIVFLNDETVIKSLMRIGQDYAEAADYAPIGCYEPASNSRELPCTCSGRFNLGKVAELTVKCGRSSRTSKPMLPIPTDITDFEGLYSAFREALRYSIDECVGLINDFEQYYPIINQSPIFSGTFESSVRDGRDIYAGGAKYENTSISVFGIATAVDSLLAVKQVVFEEKRLSLSELTEILFDNWENAEGLRNYCKSKCRRYGQGDPEADALAADIMSYTASLINGRANGRGGVYRMGGFSIDWIYRHGKKTGATPNGRFSGEPISKNLSATLGADINGVTGSVRSAMAIDHTAIPDGAVLDLNLHRSAVSGSDGASAIMGLIKTYFSRGGGAIQFNVLDPEVLKRAQADPEQYKNLQIRLCGWNVYFVNLSKQAQDEFILATENR